jgi:hypothetical protein
MTLGQQFYKVWKEQHKINLRVYTDEQMFEIGFEAGRHAAAEEQEKALWDAAQDKPKKAKSATTKLSKDKKA